MEEVIDERYQNGKIYKICKIGADENDKYYIGSTIQTLKERLRCHKKTYLQYQEGEYNLNTVFLLFKENGVENYEIILIEDYPCNNKIELEEKDFI